MISEFSEVLGVLLRVLLGCATGGSKSQVMPREAQLKHGAVRLHRSFRVLQKLQDTGRWREGMVRFCGTLGPVAMEHPWNYGSLRINKSSTEGRKESNGLSVPRRGG